MAETNCLMNCCSYPVFCWTGAKRILSALLRKWGGGKNSPVSWGCLQATQWGCGESPPLWAHHLGVATLRLAEKIMLWSWGDIYVTQAVTRVRVHLSVTCKSWGSVRRRAVGWLGWDGSTSATLVAVAWYGSKKGFKKSYWWSLATQCFMGEYSFLGPIMKHLQVITRRKNLSFSRCLFLSGSFRVPYFRQMNIF